ncbi:peptide deformylase [Corynebacterium vitaeruminis]|uniref:Peptide deformylase n=1 Tax=Corynebacterium vitaeruminis DSM 20294 TaxID=1224164 RepID=W5Y118_9CORY|nr:peptide deformylase [Corynebacterium vitaeruminis]AHI22882.1 peptide deformylase [Corynebacterium vitaeruminis DSM 20294]
MSVLDIRLFGDPVLTTRAEEITVFDHTVEQLVSDMLETMDAAGGVGLAANQVGVLRRVFVFDCSHQEDGLRGHIINPVWEAIGEETQTGAEGCLSIPDISAETTRFQTVKVSGVDMEGKPVSMVASGLMARCIQHETDHLDGVLFLRRLEKDARKEAMAAVRQSEWFNR